MTLGLFGFVINGAAAAPRRLAWPALVRRPVHDRRLPDQAFSIDAHRRGDRRLDRAGPHHHGHRARRPRLRAARGPPDRRVRAAAGASGRPVYVTIGRRPRATPRRQLRDAFPDPWLRAVLGQGERRARRSSPRLGARAASGRTSSRAASGPRHGAPASPNERITLEGIGKTAADLRAAVRAARRRRAAPLGGRRDRPRSCGRCWRSPGAPGSARRSPAARRPAPPQPGRRARDPRRPRRRRGRVASSA